MRIERLKISNILGIEELDFEAGAFNVARGKNGTGKTSVLEAIKSVVKGGDDATLLRNGATKGEIVLVIDDGTEIKRRVTQKAVQPLVVEKNGVRVDRPSDTVKALIDMISVNPVDFLKAEKKKRVNVLLESLPMSADPVRLAEIVGHEVVLQDGRHALEQIQSVYQSVYDDRTGTRRAVREKESTINQLAATLPPAAETGPEDKGGLVAELARIDDAKDAEIARIDGKLDGYRKAADDDIKAETERLSEWKDEQQAAIAGLENQILAIRRGIIDQTAVSQKVKEDRYGEFTEIAAKAEKQRTKVLTAHAQERAGTAAKLDDIDSRLAAITRARQTRDTIKSMRADADSLADDVERQDAALKQIEAYKSELLAALPIDGLAVVEGEIFRHGVVFDRLNTGQQVEIAVEIAKLRAGDLGVICVDGIESLDSEHFDAFRDRAIASGLQLFVSRVADSEFEMTAEG